MVSFFLWFHEFYFFFPFRTNLFFTKSWLYMEREIQRLKERKQLEQSYYDLSVSPLIQSLSLLSHSHPCCCPFLFLLFPPLSYSLPFPFSFFFLFDQTVLEDINMWAKYWSFKVVMGQARLYSLVFLIWISHWRVNNNANCSTNARSVHWEPLESSEQRDDIKKVIF